MPKAVTDHDEAILTEFLEINYSYINIQLLMRVLKILVKYVLARNAT